MLHPCFYVILFILEITACAHVLTLGIRQLQLMLLKVSLILGVEIHVNVEFVKLLEPPEEQIDDSKSVPVKNHFFSAVYLYLSSLKNGVKARVSFRGWRIFIPPKYMVSACERVMTGGDTQGLSCISPLYMEGSMHVTHAEMIRNVPGGWTKAI